MRTVTLKSLTAVALASLLSLAQLGCGNREAEITNLNNRVTSLEARKVSSETAILIAKGKLSTTADLKNYDFSSVTEGIDFWEVHFLLKCTDCLDRNASVVINKSDGEVVRIYPMGKPEP